MLCKGEKDAALKFFFSQPTSISHAQESDGNEPETVKVVVVLERLGLQRA